MNKIKRNIYTLVIDHDDDDDARDVVVGLLRELNVNLEQLTTNTTVHRADYDIDTYEDVTDLYDVS